MASTPPHAPIPAYASAPRRSGLLYVLAGVVALAAVVAIAIVALGPGVAPSSTAPGAGPLAGVADAQKALDAAKAALDQASKSVLQPPPSSLPPVPAGDGLAPQDATAPRAEPPAVAPPPRVAATTEAPRPVIRPAPSAPPPGKVTSAVPAPPPVAAPAAPAAPPPVQVASADRWTQMRDEMERCSSSSVIPRIQCQQRIRARYCDGHWGTVAECPTSSGRK